MDDVTPLFYYEPRSGGQATAPRLDANDVRTALGADAVRPLGRGAFGETWRVSSARRVQAVKIILNDSYPPALLQREVRGLLRVADPHVVRLHDVIGIKLSIGTRAALVFEFIDGGDVSGRLANMDRPSGREAADFLRGLLAAVCALHATGTVHRDIKPENVALRGGKWSEPVLLDLGLAKLLDVESLTAYPQLIGTAPFMSPEQVRGEPARKGADVWAVGVVSYLLLANRHPFYDGRDKALLRTEALDRLAGGPRPLPHGIPKPLAGIVTRLLSFDVHARGSAQRALKDLLR